MDLALVPYKKGRMDMNAGFDFGSVPGSAIERAIEAMNDLVDDGELAEADLAPLVFWLAQADLGCGEAPPGWKLESEGSIVCSTKALANILASIKKLEKHVGAGDKAGWSALAKLCGDAAKSGGTIAIYYDPEG